MHALIGIIALILPLAPAPESVATGVQFAFDNPLQYRLTFESYRFKGGVRLGETVVASITLKKVGQESEGVIVLECKAGGFVVPKSLASTDVSPFVFEVHVKADGRVVSVTGAEKFKPTDFQAEIIMQVAKRAFVYVDPAAIEPGDSWCVSLPGLEKMPVLKFSGAAWQPETLRFWWGDEVNVDGVRCAVWMGYGEPARLKNGVGYEDKIAVAQIYIDIARKRVNRARWVDRFPDSPEIQRLTNVITWQLIQP